MKKSFSLEMDSKMVDFFDENPELAREALSKAYWENQNDQLIEAVKIITRTKAPVWNWRDLEKEIFKGAIGDEI